MISHRVVSTSNLVLLASADLVSLLGRTTAPAKTSTSATSLESAAKLVQTRLGASSALALMATLNSSHLHPTPLSPPTTPRRAAAPTRQTR